MGTHPSRGGSRILEWGHRSSAEGASRGAKEQGAAGAKGGVVGPDVLD